MKDSFDISIFLKNLCEDLITIFNRSSEFGIHPDEVGRAKEINISKQLELILPHGVGIGRGFVFDSTGNISNQCDLVLYEKDYIPVFVRDSNKDYSYYPCEGVIAVGEIKSTLDKKQLEDSMNKLEKVKLLKRICLDNHSFRHFLQPSGIYGSESEIFDPANKSFDNIFTFIFCRDNKIDVDTILSMLFERYCLKMENGIDKVFSLNKKIISKGYKGPEGNYLFSNFKCNTYFSLSCNNHPFEVLIDDLSSFVKNGRSQKFDLKNYFKLNEIKIDKVVKHSL